jgi:hypothetical protein
MFCLHAFLRFVMGVMRCRYILRVRAGKIRSTTRPQIGTSAPFPLFRSFLFALRPFIL